MTTGNTSINPFWNLDIHEITQMIREQDAATEKGKIADWEKEYARKLVEEQNVSMEIAQRLIPDLFNEVIRANFCEMALKF